MLSPLRSLLLLAAVLPALAAPASPAHGNPAGTPAPFSCPHAGIATLHHVAKGGRSGDSLYIFSSPQGRVSVEPRRGLVTILHKNSETELIGDTSLTATKSETLRLLIINPGSILVERDGVGLAREMNGGHVRACIPCLVDALAKDPAFLRTWTPPVSSPLTPRRPTSADLDAE